MSTKVITGKVRFSYVNVFHDPTTMTGYRISGIGVSQDGSTPASGEVFFTIDN
jgi:hypothetical protein